MAVDYVYGEDERVTAWMAERIGINQFRDDVKTIGIERDGELIGGTAFDTFCERECVLHTASDGSARWLTRDYIKLVFHYPFIQLGFVRLTSFVSVNNPRSLRLAKHFGFVEEGRARGAGKDGEDLVMLGMLRTECRYIPPLIFNPFMV